MSKSSTDELVQAISTKKKKQVNKTEAIKKWLIRELWDGRPTQWLAIGITAVCVAYTTYKFATYYIVVPQFTGMATFVVSWVILSRTFRKK